MAISLPLTSSWWTASDWLNPDAPTFSLAGTGTVEYAWSVGMPPSTFYGAPLISPNAYGMSSPIAGAKLYLRITSGSVTIYYDKKDGPSFSLTLSGNAFTGGAGSDTGWVQTPTPTAGFDNITPRAAANPYEFATYAHVPAPGLLVTDTIQFAIAVFVADYFVPNRTFRVRALKYATDQSGSITSWATLIGKTTTTAYADWTTNTTPWMTFDIKAILDELKAVAGWSATSPIQLLIRDIGSAAAGADTRVSLDLGVNAARVAITLTSGGGPTPPDPGLGGP